MSKMTDLILRPNDRIFYATTAALAVGIGIINAFSSAHDAARRGGAYDIGKPLMYELTSILFVILLTPLLVAAVRSIRSSPGVVRRATLAAASLLVFSALHMLGMVALRKLLVWTAGGSYDFNLSWPTVLYEFRKDIMTVLIISTTLWLWDGYHAGTGRSSSREREDDTAVPAALWLRDGTSRLRIAPAEILWVASAGNYIEYTMAGGRQHLIRGTLSAAETELARFGLVRIHRGRLANLARVTALSVLPSGDFSLTFDTGQSIQGSRRYRSAVAQLERTSAPSPASAPPEKENSKSFNQLQGDPERTG
ncbi:LytTR family DNA-binding domain-containing protein [Bradyrhizobium sp. STM 3809]|uniref:LytTR family DNA-binding domain-containing protein n=1 Tax=Bradyrhizobium sp. STM 3809 TaxID=551936 RepID=UPI001F0AB5A9|nr:LytTR family DNA-binding domain-containing protein [Bradyrhizobium sp. STM 3809]